MSSSWALVSLTATHMQIHTHTPQSPWWGSLPPKKAVAAALVTVTVLYLCLVTKR
jgi:hypothetical protein